MILCEVILIELNFIHNYSFLNDKNFIFTISDPFMLKIYFFAKITNYN